MMQKILVIDDDVELCELVAEYLEPDGYQVEAIHEGHEGLQRALSGDIELQEAVHSGTFSVVYRATMHGEVVAVKSVPDAPRQHRIRQIVTEALPKVHKLADPAFIRLRDSNIHAEPHWFVMDYVDWPTI